MQNTNTAVDNNVQNTNTGDNNVKELIGKTIEESTVFRVFDEIGEFDLPYKLGDFDGAVILRKTDYFPLLTKEEKEAALNSEHISRGVYKINIVKDHFSFASTYEILTYFYNEFPAKFREASNGKYYIAKLRVDGDAMKVEFSNPVEILQGFVEIAETTQ